MKSLAFIAVCMLMATAGLSADRAAQPAGKQGETIKMINNKYVIDVRTKEEWDSGHIEGAVHIPVDEIGGKIGTVITDKKAALALYCHSGHRAGVAAKTLKELGYKNVENYGGISAARKKLEKK